MTKDEALRLALEALELAHPRFGIATEKHKQAITAIKAALEAKDEPWEKFCDSHCVWTDHHPDCKLAQRKPLTDEEIYLCTNHIDRNARGWANEFARAIEAAHGIKENT